MSKTVLFQTIQFSISTQFSMSTRFSSIWLRIPQSSSITGTSPSDCLVLYTGHSLGMGGGLPVCRGAVGVFYSSNRLDNSYVLLSSNLCFVFSSFFPPSVFLLVLLIYLFCSTCEMATGLTVRRNNGVLTRQTNDQQPTHRVDYFILSTLFLLNHHHHHHHVAPPARISLTISRHFSLSSIASGRSSGLHPVSSHSCCM